MSRHYKKRATAGSLEERVRVVVRGLFIHVHMAVLVDDVFHLTIVTFRDRVVEVSILEVVILLSLVFVLPSVFHGRGVPSIGVEPGGLVRVVVLGPYERLHESFCVSFEVAVLSVLQLKVVLLAMQAKGFSVADAVSWLVYVGVQVAVSVLIGVLRIRVADFASVERMVRLLVNWLLDSEVQRHVVVCVVVVG